MERFILMTCHDNFESYRQTCSHSAQDESDSWNYNSHSPFRYEQYISHLEQEQRIIDCCMRAYHMHPDNRWPIEEETYPDETLIGDSEWNQLMFKLFVIVSI
jgi:hypothetical protein